MIIGDLKSSLEAHEQRKKKKKQEGLEEALQTKMTIKEDKVMYAQYNLRRRRGRRGHSYDRSSGNNNEEKRQTN